jgi:hypothetical protein
VNETPPCIIDAAYGDPSPAGLPVSIGVPFKAGVLKDVSSLAVRAPGGESRPAAGRTLATWPDGSVRWALVSFGAREPGAHEVLWGQAPRQPVPSVTVTRDAGVLTVVSDRLRVTVCEEGPGVLGELVCDGHAYLATPGDFGLCVDGMSSRHETRRQVRILEETPLRVRLRVEGVHAGQDGAPGLNYRLDVEVWAGWPAVRLDYHYFNLIRGQPFQRIGRIAVETAWHLGPTTHRHFVQKNYSELYISRHVYNPAPVALAADLSRRAAHVEDPAMLLDDVDYPFYLHAPLVDTHDWLGVGDGTHNVYLRMEDFLDAVPNRLTSAGNSLAAEVWPSTAEALELPQGRSRRQTLTLAFLEATAVRGGTAKLSNAPVQAPKGVAAILGATVHEGRASVSPAWIAHCGEFKQGQILPAGKHVRIETNLMSLVRLDMPCTKFDVGDTDSHYNSTYAVIDDGRVPKLAGAPDIPRRFPRSLPTQTYLDCHEPVWTNNEYDAIHAVCSEVMRTGRVDLWRTLRLAARHNIEVDFLHYSDHKVLHRATPAHSARHTTTGAYPSHFWTQGLLEYYCMTGDPDALEVALALGDKTIEVFADAAVRGAQWGFNREIGWSILALACLVDIVREPRFEPLLNEMVAFVVGFDRAGYRGAINLSNGNDRQNLNRQMVGNFFGYSSMMEGVDLFADITKRADVVEWLRKLCHDLADEAMNAAREGQMRGVDFGLALGIGYERTGDERFMRMAGLVLDAAYWNSPGPQGGGSAKSVAHAYRGLMRLLGHAWRRGLLAPYEYPSLRSPLPQDDAIQKGDS